MSMPILARSASDAQVVPEALGDTNVVAPREPPIAIAGSLGTANDNDHQVVGTRGAGVMDDRAYVSSARAAARFGRPHWRVGMAAGAVAMSVGNHRPRLAPSIKIGAAPCDGARAESDRTGKLSVCDQPVYRRAAKSRHAHDHGKAQEDRCHGLGTNRQCLRWGALHGGLRCELFAQL